MPIFEIDEDGYLWKLEAWNDEARWMSADGIPRQYDVNHIDLRNVFQAASFEDLIPEANARYALERVLDDK